jgi:hypothetical protein
VVNNELEDDACADIDLKGNLYNKDG